MTGLCTIWHRSSPSPINFYYNTKHFSNYSATFISGTKIRRTCTRNCLYTCTYTEMIGTSNILTNTCTEKVTGSSCNQFLSIANFWCHEFPRMSALVGVVNIMVSMSFAAHRERYSRGSVPSLGWEKLNCISLHEQWRIHPPYFDHTYQCSHPQKFMTSKVLHAMEWNWWRLEPGTFHVHAFAIKRFSCMSNFAPLMEVAK